MNSITGGTQYEPSPFTSGTGAPDKGYMKNLVTGYPLWKYHIHQIERNEPHGSKPHYKG